MTGISHTAPYPDETKHPMKKGFTQDISQKQEDTLSPVTFTERLLRAKYGIAGFTEGKHTAESLTKSTLRYILNTYYDKILSDVTSTDINNADDDRTLFGGETNDLITRDIQELRGDLNRSLLQLANRLRSVLLENTYRSLKEEEAKIRRQDTSFTVETARFVKHGIRENTVIIVGETDKYSQSELVNLTEEFTFVSDEITTQNGIVVTDSNTDDEIHEKIRNSPGLHEFTAEKYVKLLRLYIDDPVTTVDESSCDGFQLTTLGYNLPIELIVCVEKTEGEIGEKAYPLLPWYGTVSCPCELQDGEIHNRQLCRHEMYALLQQRNHELIIDQHNVVDQECKRFINAHENSIFKQSVIDTTQTVMEELP